MDQKFCEIHNESALFWEYDDQQNQIFLCKYCIEKRLKIYSMDDVKKKEKQKLKELEMQFDESIQLLKNFGEILEQFTKQIQERLKKFQQQVELSISNINEKRNEIKNISNDFTNLELVKINEQKNIVNNQQIQIILQLNNQLKEFEISTRLDQLYQIIESKLKQFDNIEKITEIDKKFNCHLMPQSSYPQIEPCNSIAFNKDATIMIAGSENFIKVFEFKNETLSELQLLSGHLDTVYCLQFMKKSNQFISGGKDSTIIIWNLNRNNQWLINQALKGHKSLILCFEMNQNEDRLISGSYDQTIKLWQKQHDIWSCYQSIYVDSSVFSISLNDQENQLIACVHNRQIIVIKLQDKVSIIKQTVQVEQDGYRLCNINQNQFVFQPYNRQHLLIFDFDAKDQIYKKGQELYYENKETKDDAFFPIQYFSQIGLLIVKNGNHVHLIKRNQNGQFIVEQSINFNIPYINGCVSDDGRYISTWDSQTQEIQIRKIEF